MQNNAYAGKIAIITGGASGIGAALGKELARAGAEVVLADRQIDLAQRVASEIRSAGGHARAVEADVRAFPTLARVVDETVTRFGAVDYFFNNAGIGVGGEMDTYELRDWDDVFDVNLRGVAHGIQAVYPVMIRQHDGHIVNTASMAGLVNMPNMGVYNVSKHAVVSLSETLYQDLRLVSERVHAHVLAPYFVPTGIAHSERARPEDAQEDGRKATTSQRVAQGLIEKAVAGGRITATDVAQFVFDALEADRFYIYSHPKALAPVMTRAEDIMAATNPSDPYRERPELGEQLRAALRR